MQRIPLITPRQATAKANALLEQIRSTTGRVSNQMKTMAQAPAALKAFLGFDEALAGGVLSDQERVRIALTVSQTTGCSYSLDVNCALGRLAGLSEEEIRDSRRGVSPDRRLETIMQFARHVVTNQGRVTDEALAGLGRMKCGHEEIVEILANVMLVQFSSYFNFIAGTARDFPRAPDPAARGANTESPGSRTKETTTLS